jgi:tRNA pseudouridine55 synthase
MVIHLTTRTIEGKRQSPGKNFKMRVMDGALIVDKPAGMTSHTVVAHVRRLAGTRRVGHTGTLDPFATGVLVALVGRATRLMQFLNGAEKEYEAVIRFGYATDTGDMTGKPLANSLSTRSLRKEDIEAAMASLRGEIAQVPPMYSAKKIQGRKLYELARRGETVERQAVRVTISQFEMLTGQDELLQENEEGTSDLNVRVVCSAGTYVRTLAEELGEQIGVGAHLAALRRTRAGAFRIETAHTLDGLKEIAEAKSISTAIISPDAAVAHLPVFDLSIADLRRIMNGVDVGADLDHKDQQHVRLRDSAGELVAVGIYDARRKIVHPDVVLAMGGAGH